MVIYGEYLFVENFIVGGLLLALTCLLYTSRAQHTVYPPEESVFNALKYSPYEKTKVVILGQDPYHCLLYTSSFLECHGKSMSLIITQLHFCPFPTADFIKRLIMF